MTPFQLTSPNTCALVEYPGYLEYISGPDNFVFELEDGYFNITEFLTADDAATAALIIDPTYDTSAIFGPLPYTVDDESGGGNYLYGTSVSLVFSVSSVISGYSVTYQWYDEGDLALAGATSSTFNLGGATSGFDGNYYCIATVTASGNRSVTARADYTVHTYPIVGDFTLTRSGNNITSGLFSRLRGFTATTATLEVPAIPLTISYDPVDGFNTTGSPLLALDQVAELFINGEFVKSFTIHAVNGTFSYNFAA